MPRQTQEKKTLTVGVIGTGSSHSQKMVETLLTDYTSPYEEVAFIFPVVATAWSEATDVVLDWTAANDVPFIALTDGGAADKDFIQVLEDAEEVIKVARIPTKLVQMLKEESGDTALLVLWDENDEDTALAVNKALEEGIPALNLLDGLDPFSFEDEGDEPGEGSDSPAAQVGDDYDDWGVRKLRAALREHPNKAHTDRQIGQLEKDDAIRALRTADQAALKGDTPAEVVQEADEPVEQDKAERTTRARRAFAEGAAEGSGDEAQTLPRSRGGDVLTNQVSESIEQGEREIDRSLDEVLAEAVENPDVEFYDDRYLRLEALRLAVAAGASGAEAIPTAQRFAIYLKGERKSPGRPRADGSPAEPRAINPETGKPIRRRGRQASTA